MTVPDTSAARAFHILSAATGMMLRSREPNEPFGTLMVRAALPVDFRGPPTEVLAEMAVRAAHPVLRARLEEGPRLR
jgi:hypothetical protein